MATLAELKTKVLYRLALPVTDAMMASADLVESINNGIDAMAADYDWPWLYDVFAASTASGDNVLTTPDLKQRILWVSLEDELLQLRSVPDMVRYQSQTGRPVFYSVRGDTVHLHPTPDAVYPCVTGYISMQIPLVTDGEEPIPAIPPMYLPLAVLYASLEHAQRLGDTTRFGFFTSEKDRWMKRIRDNARMQAAPGRMRTRTDWYMS